MPTSSSAKRHRPDSSERSDWFHRARMREEGALQQLLALYRPLLMKLAHQRIKGALRAKVGASDVVQATVWKATQNFASQNFRERKGFVLWLITILKNEATDICRLHEAEKRKISRERSLFSPETKHWLSRLSASLSAADSIDLPRGCTLEELLAALEQLPPHYQLVLRLHYYQRLKFKAIGVVLERSADAARVLHNRALIRLRSELDRIVGEQSHDQSPSPNDPDISE